MKKIFYVGNKFMTDTRVEPLFNIIRPLGKKRMEGYNQYVGESDLFDHIEGEVAKIGYKAGEFKAFEVKEIEEGWIYLDQKNDDFDSEIILPKIPEVEPPEKTSGSGDELSEEELRETAQAYFDQMIADQMNFSTVKDRVKFMTYLSYQQICGLAIKLGYDSKTFGRSKNSVVAFLINWEPDSGLE